MQNTSIKYEKQSVSDIVQTIINLCKNEVISDIGFTQNNNPKIDLPFAISLVVHLSEKLISEINTEPTMCYFHHYRTVNYFIDQTQLKIGNILQNNGFDYIPIPASQSINTEEIPFSGRFSHKEIALKCGLGSIGKNCLFLHKEFGPRVRLGTVFTNLDLSDFCLDTPSTEPFLNPFCQQCNACIQACPSQALIGQNATNAQRDTLLIPERCSQHMKKAYQHIGRGAVCGICMKVCPIGKGKA
ncbi:MAG: epoxyqueuosine reductase [Spirochaetaceae bacterium]|nr:epoxyqueuosine reductase [Spirochaetaceae bacterium]